MKVASCFHSTPFKRWGQMISSTRNPMIKRKNRISTGLKSTSRIFVEIKVVPQIMIVSNAAKCPIDFWCSMSYSPSLDFSKNISWYTPGASPIDRLLFLIHHHRQWFLSLFSCIPPSCLNHCTACILKSLVRYLHFWMLFTSGSFKDLLFCKEPEPLLFLFLCTIIFLISGLTDKNYVLWF